ncbi:MAG TPA: hypothetical protein VLA55_03370 [Ornithinibacter sp.]|nr:hypothetical protein [Ornithinibacter sp.]
MLRRILLVAVMVAASTTMAVPAANAASATSQCPTSNGTVGTKVRAADSPTMISVTDTRTNTTVSVLVTIASGLKDKTFTITAPTGATYTLVSASWCAKSATATSPSYGTSLTGFVPATKKDTAQGISYVTVYSVTTATPATPGTTCYDDTDSYTNDLLLTGPLGDYGNAYTTSSGDGTCSGTRVQGSLTIVSLPTYDEALAFCAALSTPGVLFGQLNLLWDSPSPSSDLWLCQ